MIPINHQEEEDRSSHNNVSNVLACILIGIYFFYVGYGNFINSSLTMGLATFFIALMFVSLYFNIRGKTSIGKGVLFISVGLSVWITHHIFNLNWAVLTSFFPLALALLFFFDPGSEKQTQIRVSIIVFLLFAACFIIPRHILWEVRLSEEVAHMSNIIHLIVSFVVGKVILFIVIKNKIKVNSRLIRKNEQLSKQEFHI